MTVEHDQLQIVNVDPDGLDHLAQNLMGLGNEAEDLLRKQMITTIFIRGASAQSEGRCS